MQTTTNYNLNVIEQSDKILDSVTALGNNATSIDTILNGKQDNLTISTSISSSSSNSEVAGAKAVYDISLDNYSTTEQLVGEWINGEPLYRKTIELGVLPSSSGNYTYPHGITNMDWVYKCEAVARSIASSTKNGFAIPYTINASTLVGLFWNNTNITIATTLDRSSYYGYVTLYYTKIS